MKIFSNEKLIDSIIILISSSKKSFRIYSDPIEKIRELAVSFTMK